MDWLMSTSSGMRRLTAATALWTVALVLGGVAVFVPGHAIGVVAVIGAVGANTVTMTLVIDRARQRVQQHMTVLEAERYRDGDGGFPSTPHPRFGSGRP